MAEHGTLRDDRAGIGGGIDPTLRLGPITLAWHGVTTAAGIALAAAVAWRWAGRRGLDRDEILNLAMVAMLAGIVGARLLYLASSSLVTCCDRARG